MKFLLVVRILFYLGICFVFFATTCYAKPRTTVKNILKRVENPRQGTKTILALPYAFSSESMGLTLGVGGGMKGYGQDQLLFGATAYASFEDAVGLFLGMWDYRPSLADRMFFGASGMVAHYPKQRAYTRIFFPPDIPRPGSNDSSADQFTEDSGFDNWTDFRLEFVLPIGSGRKDPLQKYRIKNGLLVSDPVGGDTWNPLKGGVTNLMLRQLIGIVVLNWIWVMLMPPCTHSSFQYLTTIRIFPPIHQEAVLSTSASHRILDGSNHLMSGHLSNLRPANTFL